MDFEWDNRKNNANIAKHGIDFEFAKEIFSSIWISKPDNRKDYGYIERRTTENPWSDEGF